MFPRFPQWEISGNPGSARFSRDSRQPYRWRESRELREQVRVAGSPATVAVRTGNLLLRGADGENAVVRVHARGHVRCQCQVDFPEPSMKNSPSKILRGWCGVLGKEWHVPHDNGQATLCGELALDWPIDIDRPVPVEGVKGPLRTHLATLRIVCADGSHPDLQEPPTGDESTSDDLHRALVGAALSGLLRVRVGYSWHLAKCTIEIAVAEDQFRELWVHSGSPLSMDFYCTPRGLADSGIAPDEHGYMVLSLSDIRMKVITGRVETPWWVLSSRADELRHALREEHAGEIGQMPTIVNELASSAARLSVSPEAREDLISQLGFLRDIRPAFRLPKKIEGFEGNDMFGLWPTDFLALVATRPELERTSLTSDYEELWRHFGMFHIVKNGEGKSGAPRYGFEPKVDELKSIANKLLRDPRLFSPTLEWTLMDALIYAECVAYKESVFSEDKILSLPITDVIKLVGYALLEGLALSATYLIASFVGGDDRQLTWTIATGATAARWVCMAVLAMKSESPGALLAQMASTHELLKSQYFDAASFRASLYKAASQGAVFSPWVYRLLEGRIRREQGEPGQ